MKICSKCKIEKKDTDFYKDNSKKSGLCSHCKDCQRKKQRKSKSTRTSPKPFPKGLSEEEKKKAIYQRYKKYQQEYRKNNLDKRKSYAKEYYKKHKEKLLKDAKKYQKENREQYTNNLARYRAKKLLADPVSKDKLHPWGCDYWKELNLFGIKEAYKQAKHLTKLTGIIHHVDHIIPLQSDNVCGLHVYNNLQVIPGSENQSKSNKFEITI